MSETEIKNRDELLQMFVCTDDMRAKLMKPWIERDNIFASESHICIRTKMGVNDNADYPRFDDGKTNQLFPVSIAGADGKLSFKILENALSYAPMVDEMDWVGEDIECEECGGTGQVHWDYRCWTRAFDCPVCDGTGYSSQSKQVATGKKVVDPEACVAIESVCFRACFLNMLLEAMKFLHCEDVSVTLTGPSFAARFELTYNTDIIIMPVMQNNPYKTIHLS